MNREIMENWLILEGWEAYNHKDDQTWDQWAFSRDGVNFWFRFVKTNEANARISRGSIGVDEIPFSMARVPDADLALMYETVIAGELP